MAYTYLDVTRAENVTTVRLNRPEVMNAINAPMHFELQQAFDDFADDPTQYVCVITGAGNKAFCAGSDLKSIAREGGHKYPSGGYAGLIERFDLCKPLVAAVNGIAVGGGFEIALACDVIVASENARFGLPEPLVGLVALGGGLHRLARQIGLKKAMGMVLTGESVSATDGMALGFVNEVVHPDGFPAAVQRWCAKLLKVAPLASRASKEAILRGLDEPSLAAALKAQNAYPAFVQWRAAEDTREGPRAFAEKRVPAWVGR